MNYITPNCYLKQIQTTSESSQNILMLIPDKNNKKVIVNLTTVKSYLNSIPLTDNEKQQLLNFYNWILSEKPVLEGLDLDISKNNFTIDNNIYNNYVANTTLGEMILCYFASHSPTNPHYHQIWKQWMKFRITVPLELTTNLLMEQWLDTNTFSIGWDRNNLPVFFNNYRYYRSIKDPSHPQIVAKSILYVFL